MTSKWYNHRLQTHKEHHVEETYHTNNQTYNSDKATGSLCLSEMIAKLERKLGTTQCTMDQTKKTQTMGAIIKNHSATTKLTAVKGTGNRRGFNAVYLPNLALDSALIFFVKTQIIASAH